MKVTIVYGMKDLPGWVDRDELPNNGAGKEWASYLLIEDGEYRACYSTAMEPEDATFGRDLSWIRDELLRASEQRGKRGTVHVPEWWPAAPLDENCPRCGFPWSEHHGDKHAQGYVCPKTAPPAAPAEVTGLDAGTVAWCVDHLKDGGLVDIARELELAAAAKGDRG